MIKRCQTVLAVFVPLLLVGGSSLGALRVVESVPVTDFDVPSTGSVQSVTFSTAAPVSGVGFSALWTAVNADVENGTAPWSSDLSVMVASPGGAMIDWELIGGEISIADYPLQDATEAFVPAGGAGEYTWTFDSVSGPWVAGLRGVAFHALESVPDVVGVIESTTVGGPMWDRPFSIVGISSQGPVSYDAIEFTVPVSGLYTLESVHPDGSDHWASFYEGGFDPTQPLANQLDYGLGNGFAINDSPRGTSLVEALLFTGRTYTMVTSQWASFRPATDYTLTVTGPAAISVTGDCPADLDGDGAVGAADLAELLAAWGQGGPADFDGSGGVDAADLAVLLAAWGACE